MDGNRLSVKELGQRAVFVLIFLTLSMSIMIILSPWVAVPRLGWINDYIIFTGIHSWVSYTADNRIFLAFTFPLALALGYLMKKTDSVWGSILIHAGMDIPVMLGKLSQLT